MSWRTILIVLVKELRETLRDRRTLFIMIVVPVLLYPAMLVLMEQTALFGRRSIQADPVRVAVVGGGAEVSRFLAADEGISVTADTVPLEALRERRVEAVVIFADEGWTETGTNALELLYDGTRDRSGHARSLVERRLGEWRDSLVHARLELQGLPRQYAAPLRLTTTSIATPREVGGYMLGRFLPLLLILMTILGAFYPSIDLAAGEKERGTLESLLTVPVHADNLVVGKFAAAALMGLTAATLNLGSMLLTFQAGVVQLGGLADVRFELPAHAVLVIFAMLALLAVLFSALFLGIAVRSHSFKEAQNALTPVYLLSVVPSMLPLIPGMEFGFGFALVPVAGVAFLFRDLMSGDVAMAVAAVAVAATVAYTALALAFAARSFGREEVLFASGDAPAAGGLTGWFRRSRPTIRPVPSAVAALGLVLVVALLFFYGARPLAMAHGEQGILLAQWLFLAVPALFFVLAGRFHPRRTLNLRVPSAQGAGAALLIIAGGIPLGWLIGWLQGFVLEIPYEFLEALQRFVTAEDARRVMWLLFVVALTPAVCEELVFRGVLLNGLGTRLSMWGSIAATAVTFGAFHLSFETAIRFLPTAWLGLLLGYVVWQTRSILAGMLMHFANNAAAVVLVNTPSVRERFADPGGQPPWLLVALAPLVLYAGIRLLPGRQARRADRGGGA